VQFAAPDGYAIALAISLFLGMVVGGVGWLPGSFIGAAFIIFVPNIAEGIQRGSPARCSACCSLSSSSSYRTAQGS
jgi:ABC-type branched-subunit amino acid transport system permease subunit